MGYFEHLEHRPLTAIDRLQRHCFRDYWGKYVDESGRLLAGDCLAECTEPVEGFVLCSFRTLDEYVSTALGIPLSPADE